MADDRERARERQSAHSFPCCWICALDSVLFLNCEIVRDVKVVNSEIPLSPLLFALLFVTFAQFLIFQMRDMRQIDSVESFILFLIFFCWNWISGKGICLWFSMRNTPSSVHLNFVFFSRWISLCTNAWQPRVSYFPQKQELLILSSTFPTLYRALSLVAAMHRVHRNERTLQQPWIMLSRDAMQSTENIAASTSRLTMVGSYLHLRYFAMFA